MSGETVTAQEDLIEGPIAAAISSLTSVTERTVSCVKGLEERLVPIVSTPEPSNPEKGPDRARGNSALEELILVINSQLEEIAERINSIINRIQL